MSKKSILVLVLTVFTVFLASGFYSDQSQDAPEGNTPIKSVNLTKGIYGLVGEMMIPPESYGLLGTIPHDLTKTPGAQQFKTEFSLWIGGKNNTGDVFVVSGDGNELTNRPEWRPLPRFGKRFEIDSTNAPVEQFRVTTVYGDVSQFDGHNPVGLEVSQELVTYTNSKNAFLQFDVSNTNQNAPLTDVYIGLAAKIETPGIESEYRNSKTRFNLSNNGGNPYIVAAHENGSTGSLYSVVPVSTAPVNIAWWGSETDKLNDKERYRLLKGTPHKKVNNKNDIYTILVSAGPIDLEAGDTEKFSIILSNGKGEDNLDNTVSLTAASVGVIESKPLLLKSTAGAGFDAMPSTYELKQNYPNPFNPTTTIQYSIIEKSLVNITILDVTGQVVRKLIADTQPAGTHHVEWDSRNDRGITVASGIYFYRVEASSGQNVRFQEVKKMVLVK